MIPLRSSAHGKLLQIAASLLALTLVALAQESEPAHQTSRSGTADNRAAATRAFLGLGAMPDRAAVARGEPLYQQNCAFCHGAKGRGATAPALITSDAILADDHGERIAPFLRTGRPEKGMPAFAQLSNQQRVDIAEYLHQQVEDVANRGAYELPNIVVGDAAQGKLYVAEHCERCHAANAFAHIASRFRSPDQLQRGWIWPAQAANQILAVTATVMQPGKPALSGRVSQISDFRITLISASGEKHLIDRKPGVSVQISDPLLPHQTLVNTLKNSDMHNVTAYLETLR